MAEAGIRRPEEFEEVFRRFREEKLIERFTELVVLSAFVGFWAERTGDGPFHHPVEWSYFSADEKHGIYMLAIAHTQRSRGVPDPKILDVSRQKELFETMEHYVHGGMIKMREVGVFTLPTREAYGHRLADFVLKAMQAKETPQGEVSLRDLLANLRELEGEA